MGRSVMTHPDSVVTAFMSWEEGRGSTCRYCDDDVEYESGSWVIKGADVPEYCAAHERELVEEWGDWYQGVGEEAVHRGWEYDSDDFTDDLEFTAEHMKELWPSLYDTERWPYDEVHVFLENELAEFSVSEYSGLVALCIAPRSDTDGETRGLAVRWIEAISEKFLSTFGAYSKVGTFSNGESVYVVRGEDK